jgi:hypothetical protein
MYSHGRLALVGVVLLGVTQLAGNLLLLRSFRNADYSGLGARLQALIPPNESVYGAITFWMALHDRTYYCYDRTDAQYAEEQFRPSYVIFNDRVMVRGSGYGSDSHAELRSKLGDWIRRSGTLAGKVPDPFLRKARGLPHDLPVEAFPGVPPHAGNVSEHVDAVGDEAYFGAVDMAPAHGYLHDPVAEAARHEQRLHIESEALEAQALEDGPGRIAPE